MSNGSSSQTTTYDGGTSDVGNLDPIDIGDAQELGDSWIEHMCISWTAERELSRRYVLTLDQSLYTDRPS
jgi:hypothetical protein